MLMGSTTQGADGILPLYLHNHDGQVEFDMPRRNGQFHCQARRLLLPLVILLPNTGKQLPMTFCHRRKSHNLIHDRL